MTTIIGAPCCEKCAFSHREGKQLQCRRIPPTAFAVPGSGGVMIMSAYPPVKSDGLCGEFKKNVIIEAGGNIA
jgi:hypothetical protein